MSRNPLVTVLICNYNYGQFLAQAIDSVLDQTWQNIEVIVVDDGSTDDSRQVLERYKGCIRTILKENGGQASAFNVGVAESRGSLICFLDSDDVCYPNRVSCVVKKYEEAAWGLVCHDLALIDGDGRSIKTKWSNYAGVNMAEGNFRDVILKNNYSWVFSPTSGMSVPKSLADKIFPISCEKWKICADEPLAFSAACLDSVGIIAETLGSYRLHGNNLFAMFHDDMKARTLAALTHTTRRYFFCKQRATGYHCDLPHPKSNYHYYRLCCLIGREKPYRYIISLLKKNIKYHYHKKEAIYMILIHIVSHFINDVLIILARTFKKASKHNLVKKQFEKEYFNFDEDQIRYILYDE